MNGRCFNIIAGIVLGCIALVFVLSLAYRLDHEFSGKYMTWQPTEDGLHHLVLLQPVDGELPSRDALESFFGRMQNEATAQRNWNALSELRLDISSGGRWVRASFDSEFSSWTLVGQLVSPDAIVTRGSIEIIPRIARHETIGSRIDPVAIRRAWDALRIALEEIAQNAADDLNDHLPTSPSI